MMTSRRFAAVITIVLYFVVVTADIV